MKGFTIEEWMEAEAKCGVQGSTIKPKGGITVRDYMAEINMSEPYCRRRLHKLYTQGFATRQRWFNGGSGATFVYILKPKKEWPKK